MCSDAQLCPTLCDPMNCSPPGFSVQEILQARILERVAMSSSRGSHVSYVSCTGRQSLPLVPPGKPTLKHYLPIYRADLIFLKILTNIWILMVFFTIRILMVFYHQNIDGKNVEILDQIGWTISALTVMWGLCLGDSERHRETSISIPSCCYHTD